MAKLLLQAIVCTSAEVVWRWVNGAFGAQTTISWVLRSCCREAWVYWWLRHSADWLVLWVIDLVVTALKDTCWIQVGRIIFATPTCFLLIQGFGCSRRQLYHWPSAIQVVFTGACRYLTDLIAACWYQVLVRRLVKVLCWADFVYIIVTVTILTLRLEDIFRFLSCILSTEWMAMLQLGILKNLFLKITNLAFMACRSFHWAKRAIVLVTRSDRHIVETIIGDTSHTYFHSTPNPCIHLYLLSRIGMLLHTLVDHALIGHPLMLLLLWVPMVLAETSIFLGACGWLDWLFRCNVISIVTRFLQLHGVLEITKLVVTDEQVASALWVWSRLLKVARAPSIASAAQLSFLSGRTKIIISSTESSRSTEKLFWQRNINLIFWFLLTFFFSLELSRVSWLLRFGVAIPWTMLPLLFWLLFVFVLPLRLWRFFFGWLLEAV